VRSREKIETKSDDLGFAEEIWAQLQRAVELVIKEAEAFDRIYLGAANKRPRVDTTDLHELQSSIGEYRNILHEPIQASIKNADGIRLIPRRDTLDKYKRWTDVMYHRTEEDFVPVDAELHSDFHRVCGILQGVWSDIERASREILENKQYLTKRNLGNAGAFYRVSQYNVTSTTSNVAIIDPQVPWWKG